MYIGAGTSKVQDLEDVDFVQDRWTAIEVTQQITTYCGKDVAPTY